MKTISYSQARAQLKAICDEVADTNETVIVTRRDGGDVVLLSMEKYSKFLNIFNDMTNGLQLRVADEKLMATAELL